MTLYFLKYNNYYNRLVKKEDSIEDYLQYVVGSPLVGCINWNPNDGINTEQVVDSYQWTSPQNPDYVVAVTEDGEIDSRWFVIESTRLRNGQYKMLLHRDVIVDNFEQIVQAPMFIEKATPIGLSDPAIYNREQMTFNQIKQSETLLKDETGVPWIVGYIPSDATFGNAISITMPLANSYDLSVDSVETWEPYKNHGNAANYLGGEWTIEPRFCVQVRGSTTGDMQWTLSCTPSGPADTKLTFDNYVPSLLSISGNENRDLYNSYSSVMSQLIEDAKVETHQGTTDEILEFLSYQNKIVYDIGANKYYKVSIVSQSSPFYITTVTPESSLYNLMKNNLPNNVTGTPDSKSFNIVTSSMHYYMTLQEQNIKISVKIGDRPHLADSPYDMFCIPYGPLTVYNNGVAEDITLDESIVTAMATEIGHQAGKDNVYDLQLLPYCPLREAINESGQFDISLKARDDIKQVTGTDGEGNDILGDTLGYIFWCYNSNFTFNIPVSIPGGNTVQDKKIINETQMWRLCSPNYQGVFEFNAAQNNGVEWVNVDATYKPFAPYIHLNPNFKNLYGEDFNDSRGLICGGDYSLPQVNNAWADYQLNNKNYQQIFDREIQNLEVQRDVQRTLQGVSIATGGLSGATSGAMTGQLVGGAPGAIIGGIAGGAGSIAGGIADYYMSEKLYNENLDYKRDMFGYQLGNIKALPSSLARTSALTFNNKLFPFIEWYNCTEQETQALKDKLKYNGYSIGRIGKMEDYILSEPSYIKGQIIRIEGIADDFHGLKAISDELYKGVFV